MEVKKNNCKTCTGTGSTKIPTLIGLVFLFIRRICVTCKGSGKVHSYAPKDYDKFDTCGVCGGDAGLCDGC